MKGKKFFGYVVIAVLAIAFAVMTIYNLIKNPNFWDASAVNVITILIAVVISFYLVQRKNDQRKQKDILLDLILKLQLQIGSEDAYNFKGQTQPEITMRNRDISNKIHILKETENIFSTQEDVKFIEEKFEEYRSFIDNHITDIDYLTKSTTDLRRPLDLIINRLVSMSIGLYT